MTEISFLFHCLNEHLIFLILRNSFLYTEPNTRTQSKCKVGTQCGKGKDVLEETSSPSWCPMESAMTVREPFLGHISL